MLRLELANELIGCIATLHQQREQRSVFARVMVALGKLAQVIEHGVQQPEPRILARFFSLAHQLHHRVEHRSQGTVLVLDEGNCLVSHHVQLLALSQCRNSSSAINSRPDGNRRQWRGRHMEWAQQRWAWLHRPGLR